MATPATQTPNPTTAIEKKEDKIPPVAALVQQKLDALMKNGRIVFPEDYSVENAMASARLALQNVVNKDQKAIVDGNGRPTGVVTTASMVNAVLDMCIQGLNVAKKQCYFIVYGNQLLCQRSYFGDMALAQRINPNIEFYFQPIYEGDVVRQEILGGRTVIMSHQTDWKAQDKPIEGAYCGCRDKETGEDLGCVIMTIERIEKSWMQSKTYKFAKDRNETTHGKFTTEMALRTVIRKRCVPIINSSSDALLLESVRRQDEERVLGTIDAEIAEQGNGEVLALDMPSDEPAVFEDAQAAAPALAPEEPKATTPKATKAEKPVERLSSEVQGTIEEPAAF